MIRNWLIELDGLPLIIVKDVPEHLLKTEVLDWYAKEYAFEREKLVGWIIEIVSFEKEQP